MIKNLLLLEKFNVKRLQNSICGLILMALLCTATSSRAQLYYLTNNATPTTVDALDAVNKINYDGTGQAVVRGNLALSPVLMELDIPNNRAFVYEGYSTNPPADLSIKVINLSTGEVSATIPIVEARARVGAIQYDAKNNYLYYTIYDEGATGSGNGPSSATSSDALIRIKPDGTGKTVMQSGLIKNPVFMALDISNDRAFIYQNLFAEKKFFVVKLSTGGIISSFENIPEATAPPYIVVDIAYDAVDDYIYFLSSNNEGATHVNDALRRIHPDGTFLTTIAQITNVPVNMTLDAGNNRAFIYSQEYNNQVKSNIISSVNLTTGAITPVKNVSDIPVNATISKLYASKMADLNTTAAINISSASAVLGGNVNRSDAAVTARGVVYSSSNTTPTIGAAGVTSTTNGTGTGSFSASITGLSPVTTYYARPYATSAAGTSYGPATTFTTPSNNANLSAIAISSGTLNPVFSESTTSYSTTVDHTVSSITVTPTRTQGNATIKVNGTAVTSASASNAISLNYGANTITVAVTAEDNTTTKTYTLTVNRDKIPQTITVLSGDYRLPYSSADFTIPGISASSGLTVSYSSGNQNVLSVAANGTLHITGSGYAAITISQPGNTTYASATPVVQGVWVDKGEITVTAAAKTKVYGNADPAFTYTYTGNLRSGDTFSGTLSRTAGINVGNYTINLGTVALNDNYTVTYVPADLTITRRPLTVAPLPVTKIYGEVDFANGAPYNLNGTSLAQGDAMTGVFSRDNTTQDIGVYNLLIGSKHPVNANTGEDLSANYDVTFVSNTFTITKRDITLKPADRSKVYGDADPYLNAFSITSGSLAPGSATSGAFERAAGENVGTYNISSIGNKVILDATNNYAVVNNNYNITIVPGTLTITKRPATVTATEATKAYGDADPVFTYVADNVKEGDTFTGGLSRSAGETVGAYTLNKGTLALNSNYNLTFTGSNSLTIGPKTITVTATPATKVYGNADPEFTYTYTGTLKSGDAFTGALSRTSGIYVGDYPINQGTLALSENYAITYVPANLTITKRPLNIAPLPVTKTYGEVDFVRGSPYTFNGTSLAQGDGMTGSFSRDNTTQNAGVYNLLIGNKHPVNTSTGADLSANYDISFVSNTFTINKAALTYNAAPALRFFSESNPVFTGNITGFVNNDALPSATTGTLVFESATDKNTPIGTYAITGSGLSAANYTFVQAPANNNALTITLSADANLSALSVTQGVLNQPFSPNQTSYYFNVAHEVTSFDLTASLSSAFASLKINEATFASGSTNNLALNAGYNNFNITVTAQDGSTKQYQLGVNRAYSPNNNLTGINLTNVTLTPAFNNSTLAYTALVDNTVTSTDITATVVDATANASVNGNIITATEAYNYPLSVGENVIGLRSTAQNGDTKYFTVTITRKESSDATLSSIGNAAIALNTPFVSGTYSYHATVTASTENNTFLPVSTNNFATVTINGQPLNRFSGNFVSLNFGNNNVTISVTSQDGSSTINYIVNVIRQRSNEAHLNNLVIPFGGSINETFDQSLYDYTANVSDSTYTGLLLKINRSTITSSVKVNNQPVADPENYHMKLYGGLNNFKIEVTSQDTSVTKTYNLAVTRAGQAPPAKSPDASLASLTISGGTSFSRNFNFSYEQLETVNTSNAVTSVRFFINRAQSGATVTVNGAVVDNPEEFGPADLVVGDNIFNILVTAEDGVVTRNYEVHVNRLPFVDVTLASLKVNKGTLSPVFSPAVTTYNVTTASSDSTITITPVANVLSSRLEIGADTISVSKPSSTQELFEVGQTRTINVRVTAADGITTRNYRLRVTRPMPSAVATLTNLSLNIGTMSPAFDTETRTYSANVANTITKVSVKPVLTDATSTVQIRVNDGAYVPAANNVLSAQLKLNLGVNKIDVLVTAEDKSTTENYTINVKRLYSNTDATLAELSLSNTTISPVFASNVLGYKAFVDNATDSTVVRAVATNPDAKITVNGITVNPAVDTVPISRLAIGTSYAKVVVTSTDGTVSKTYQLKISRAPSMGSGNADVVFSLRNKPKLIEVATGPAKVNYVASVDPATTFITVTPTSKDMNAQVEVDGVITPRGQASAPITLTGDTTLINILSTAQNGVTKTYSIAVVKQGSNNPDVAIALSNNAILVKGTSSATQVNLTTSVSPTLSSITLTATATDPNASVRIQGVLTPRGQAKSIPLTGAVTIINVVSTAQDGVTTRTYSIAVSKQGSNNAELAFTLSSNPKLVKLTGGPAGVNYITSVDASIPLTVTTKSTDGNAKVTIQGVLTARNTASAPIALVNDTTMINIVSTAQDGVTANTYSVAVLKQGSNNADIALAVSGNPTLTKVGASTDQLVNMVTTVNNGITSITVTATAKDANANVTIQGVTTPSGQPSAPIVLTNDTTMVAIVCTAQNGTTTRTYNIAVVKPVSLRTSDIIVKNNNATENLFTLTEKEVSIYPNPFVDHVSIELKGYTASQVSVVISTMQGNAVFNRTVPVNNNKIDLSLNDFKQGVYIINISINGERKAYRIFKN